MCVIKMGLNDLSLVKEYDSNLSDANYAYDIAVDSSSNLIWVAGSVESEKWRIEILDRDLNLIKGFETDIGASETSIGFDGEGYSYIVDDGGVVKLSNDGVEVKRFVQPVFFSKTLWLNNRLYAVSGESIDEYIRQVLYVFDRELNLLNKTIISESVDADTAFLMGKMVSDGENIYAAGLAYVGYYDYEWVIYSIRVSGYSTLWYVMLILASILLSVSALLLLLVRRKKRLKH